jgi:hypothetical protein
VGQTCTVCRALSDESRESGRTLNPAGPCLLRQPGGFEGLASARLHVANLTELREHDAGLSLSRRSLPQGIPSDVHLASSDLSMVPMPPMRAGAAIGLAGD